MSKVLNRIAPQDEVLLETDIGKMIPSAEQLAEERVTRFNADKEIRLRVKTLEDTVSPDALTQAVERAETAKADAVKAQGEASKSAEQASTSASNASKSETNAKTAETNAKASATQAENATALKVDQRINTDDNSEYPLVVMVDKDVYKFIAPKGLTKTSGVRYCCDGTAHYFVTSMHFYEYDEALKFVKRVAFSFGNVHYNASEGFRDFVTKMGGYYYLFSRDSLTITKCSINDGAVSKEATAVLSGLSGLTAAYVQVFRNERSGHIIVFSKFTDGCGYIVLDENLIQQGDVAYIDCVDDGFIYNEARLYHFNIPDNVTFVTFAPTDATKNGVYYLDKQDKLVEFDATEILASGAFTNEDLTKTGRTSANYSIPRIFYEIQFRGQYHKLLVFNGAKIVPLIVHPKEDGKPVTIEHKAFNGAAISGVGDAYIKEANVPKNRLTATSVVMANGSGNSAGQSTYYQPFACIANAILTKPYTSGTNTAFTDFAPDPFENSASYKPLAMSNTHPVHDKTSVTNKWHLYPAGDYNNWGGAIMFTV